MMMHRLLFVGCAMLLLLAGGCGRDDGPERVVVSGAVTLDGQPIPKGLIRFVPEPGTKAPLSTAAIVDGKYEAAAKGGVPVGTHRIIITAKQVPNDQASAKEPMDRALGGGQYIPAKYNKHSELKITIPTGSEAITKDLALVN